MEELVGELDCPMYTGDEDNMTNEKKGLALKRWVRSTGPKVIVATTALGVGSGYLEVRWVVYASVLRSMMVFL